jgi:signal transduction histidine kinase
MKYGKQFYQLSLESKNKAIQRDGLERMGVLLWRKGNTEKSIELLLKVLRLSEELNDSMMLSYAYFDLANAYNSENDDRRAINYYSKALKIAPASFSEAVIRTYITLGSIYLKRDQLDSALVYGQYSYKFYEEHYFNLSKLGDIAKYLAVCLNLLGNAQYKLNHTELAREYYRQGVKEGFIHNNLKAISDNYISIAKLFKEQNSYDSAYYYAAEAYTIAKIVNSPYSIEETSSLLKDLFKENNKLDSAFKYQEIMLSARDSIINVERIRQVQNLSLEEELKQQELGAAKIKFQNTIKLYALLIAVLVFIIISFILYRNNRHKQKANVVLQQQKEKIQSTLTQLKSAQAQLIQSEKMASLGELTAGIAHEIQNPLNFVNNFSEVNSELIDELEDEVKKGNLNEVKTIAKEIKDNEQKISHHGKRADAIVKGMLQHSRISSGQKEPTSINALCDEYLRLAYHGFRAKDKSFNVNVETDFDDNIGKINIIPQDIGRVVLNLISNAFYAVSEKKKQNIAAYEPIVTVSTKKLAKKCEIKVSDNGNGIPKKVLDKIFQPFFTTKPTGQGTGLGLSLAYDIITKGHGGEITVETKEGEGSEFRVILMT